MTRLIIGLLLLLLMGCNSPSVEGTSSETINSFAGVVHLSNGSIPETAKVWLIAKDHSLIQSESWIIDSTTTDKKGRFSFVTHVKGAFSVQVAGDGEAALISGFDSTETFTNLDTIELQPSASIKGEFATSNAEMQLIHTACGTQVDSLGNIQVNNVPMGTFGIMVDGTYCGAVKVSPGELIDLDTITPQYDFLEVEDFNHLNEVSSLTWLFPTCKWKLNISEKTTTEPKVTDNDFSALASEEDSWRERSLQFTTSSISVKDTGKVNLHLPIGEVWESWDLSKMTSISIAYKGSGDVQIYFTVEPEGYAPFNLFVDIIPTSTWIRLNFSSEGLHRDTDNANEIPNEVALSSVTAMGISVESFEGNSVHLQADEFRLEGIEIFDLLQ